MNFEQQFFRDPNRKRSVVDLEPCVMGYWPPDNPEPKFRVSGDWMTVDEAATVAAQLTIAVHRYRMEQS